MKSLTRMSLAALALSVLTVASLPVAQAKTVVDVTACNYTGVFDQYNATMPAGTVKQSANPEFVMTGASLCAAQMSVRFVLVTKPYVYNPLTNQLEPIAINGYPFTEVTKDMVVKPGVFSVKYRAAEYNVSQVTQMRTQITAYPSSAFDASGKLLPDAQPLATDEAGWTKTNFITL